MNALQKYEGTVVIVSHDREFIDGLVDKVIEVKNKKIKTFFGNATEYLKAKEDELKKSLASNKKQNEVEKKPVPELKREVKQEKTETADQKKKKKEVNKIILPLKSKISELEKSTVELEAKIKEKEALMAKDEFYKGGYNVLDITNEYNSMKEKLKNVYLSWEAETEKLNNLSKELI